jgi:hypothetical protein
MAENHAAPTNRIILTTATNELVTRDGIGIIARKRATSVVLQITMEDLFRVNKACFAAEDVSLPDLADSEPHRAYYVTRFVMRQLAAGRIRSVTIDDEHVLGANPDDPEELKRIGRSIIDNMPDALTQSFDFTVEVTPTAQDAQEFGLELEEPIHVIGMQLEPANYPM